MDEQWESEDAALLLAAVGAGATEAAPLDDVLTAFLAEHGDAVDRARVEAGVRRLLGAGLVRLDATDRMASTPAGAELAASVRRSQGINRILRLHQALQTYPVAPVATWQLDAQHWSAAAARHRQHEQRALQARLDTVEALLKALAMFDQVNHAVKLAADRAEAVAALTRPRFGFTETQAFHILDIRVGLQTAEERTGLEAERDRLRDALKRATEGSPGLV